MPKELDVTVEHPALADEQAYLDDAYGFLERGLADAEASIAAAVPGDRVRTRLAACSRDPEAVQGHRRIDLRSHRLA